VGICHPHGLGSVGRRGARLPVAFTEVRGTGFACPTLEKAALNFFCEL